MRVDAAVDDRDTDALAGQAELRPDLRRADLEDPGRARFRAVERRVELRPELLVLDDVVHVGVARERQGLNALHVRGHGADDRKAVLDAAALLGDRLRGRLDSPRGRAVVSRGVEGHGPHDDVVVGGR